MATAAKKTVTTGTTKPAETSARAGPHMRFHHSQALRDKADAALAALENTPADARHGAAVAELVAELTQAGMDYYFLKALRRAQVGMIAEQSARLAMAGAVKLVSTVSRKYIVGMNQTQLLQVAAHMRDLSR